MTLNEHGERIHLATLRLFVVAVYIPATRALRRWVPARLVARREAALSTWGTSAAHDRTHRVTSNQTAPARRRLRLWDTLLDLWTLRGRR